MPNQPIQTFTNIPGAVLNAALLPGKLSICHGNAQSICARSFGKLDEIRQVLTVANIDVACFTESWLSTKKSNRSVSIDGYSLIRNDRVYATGGGIAVYYSKRVSCTNVFHTELTAGSADRTEGLALDLHVAGHRLLLFVVYNPPGNDCSNFLETKLAELATKYEDILLIGDFNTDLLRPSNKRSQFESVLRNFSICPVSEEATYFHNNGCSQLDLLLTTSAEKVLRFGQVSFPGLSQHDLIFASLDFDVAEPLTTTTYRDYVNFDAQSLKDAVLCIPWNRFYEFSEPEESVDFFTDQLKTVHDAYIPLRTRSNRKKANAWFTATVQRSMLERDLAYKDWQHATPDSKAQKRQLYNFLRNRANALVKRAKEQHLNGFLSNTNSNTLWKRVRSLGIGKEKAQHVCEFDPDQINQMFLSNFTVNSTGDGFSRRRLPTPFNFSFRPVQYWEVVNAIYDIGSNAAGLDGLPINFLKIVLPLVFRHITHMFNMLIEKSVFPTRWKHAKILPLKKKQNLNNITNLRPISILCAISKAFEKLLVRQMTQFIDENRLLSEHQAGFRKGQSIKTAILRVHDDLSSTVDKKGAAILVLLDFSKAFDTIPHDKLCEKLQNQFFFSDPALLLLKSYLIDRKQTVFCGDQSSSCGEVTSGVPQGSIFGPLLFCCHINDLPTELKHCSIQMYADDVQLYAKGLGPCVRELSRMVNADLQRVSEWSQRNGLLVNPTKSKAVFVRSQNRRIAAQPLQDIEMDGMRIEWADKVINLGYVFQNDLKWDGLVAQQCGKIYAGLRSLYSCVPTAPVSTKLKLFKTLILPHFLFGDSFLLNPSASCFNRLRVALNCCVRYVYDLNRYAHVSHLQKNLIGCPIQNLYAYRCCVFLRRLMASQFPPVLYQKLIPCRGRRLQNLVIPRNSTQTYANSLFVRGVAYWNSLPVAVKCSTSEVIFKRGCLEFFNQL